MPGFHEGEQAVQREAGVFERLAQLGPRVIRDHMPDQHREFFPLLPFVLLGSVDAGGQPWASVLAGEPGFVHSPHPQRLRVGALPAESDPLRAALRTGAKLGLLGIQPHTRRRNRMNGTVVQIDAGGFELAVDQSFGNCPKYIQPREPVFVAGHREAAQPREMARLDEAARALVARADTFFIATAHPRAGTDDDPNHGVDVSHRGGPAGFVEAGADGAVLTVPDYVGNFFFNTLGNLQLNPRCGLVFVDFEGGAPLQVAARGGVLHDPAEVARFPGAQRLLRLEVTAARYTAAALPLRWAPVPTLPGP
jgi:predicted pyridoxine 5'-phosphate oxidase superfamily flavin-nucleotide-binding protein